MERVPIRKSPDFGFPELYAALQLGFAEGFDVTVAERRVRKTRFDRLPAAGTTLVWIVHVPGPPLAAVRTGRARIVRPDLAVAQAESRAEIVVPDTVSH